MKRLFALLIAASLCLPTASSAWWQSIQQVGVGGAPPAGLVLDGNVGAVMSGTTTASVNLTTTKPNDVIIVLVAHSPFTTETVSVTSPHLTFGAPRATANRFNGSFCYEYKAIASSPLTAETITFTSTAVGDGLLNGFAINGANVSSPFDPNAALPGVIGTGGAGGPPYASVTTTNSNTFIYSILSFDSTANPLPGAGWTALQTLAGPPFPYVFLTEYQIVSAPQTGVLASSSNGPDTNLDASIADAVTQ